MSSANHSSSQKGTLEESTLPSEDLFPAPPVYKIVKESPHSATQTAATLAFAPRFQKAYEAYMKAYSAAMRQAKAGNNGGPPSSSGSSTSR